MSKFKKGNFVGLHRGEETDYLQRNHPNAFLLLCLIARRARYTEDRCPVTGLGFGEAFIGDWKAAGLHSRSSYRCAQATLKARALCVFKGAKGGANRGTTATLLPQGIFSISLSGTANGGANKEPSSDHQATNKQPSGEPQTTKEPDNKDNHDNHDNHPGIDLKKVEEIYRVYPKKTGLKSEVIKAITSALKKISIDDLLQKTKSYAKAREGEDPYYTTSPIRWFNNEGYSDDPSTWSPSSTSSGKPDKPRQTVEELMKGKPINIIDASDLEQ